MQALNARPKDFGYLRALKFKVDGSGKQRHVVFCL